MIDPLEPFLRTSGFALLDGGLATELERRGAELSDPLWSAKVLLEAPELIEEVHYDYFASGADVGTSASYQATFEGLAERGLGRREAAALLKLSVELVRRARARFWDEPARREGRIPPLVAASVGCYGAFLHDGSEYRGDYGLSREELAAFHRPRLAVLTEAGADLLALETIPCRLEAESLIELLSEGSHRAWMSFSCRNEREVSHGEPFAECVELAFAERSIVAAGVNCTAPELVAPLLESAAPIASVMEKPLVAYPNSGELWDGARHCWTGEGASARLPELASEWLGRGARLIGGCCRTTPQTIRDIAAALSPSA